MRFAMFLAALMLLLVAAPALAHGTHGTCTTSKTLVNSPLAHVDAFTAGCGGVVASSPQVWCSGGQHIHNIISGTHVLVAYGSGCQTGVVYTTPLLP